MKKILALALADAKNIARDSTLILILFGPIGIFVFLRFLVPVLAELAATELAFDLAPHVLFLVSFMSLIPPMLFGMVFGYLILDERDEEILAFVAVTPLGKTGYLRYKLLAAVVLSFLFFFPIIYFTGLITIPLKYAFGLALLTACEAPLVALFLAAFAENKVEGMAYSKIIGVMYIAPFVAYFVKANWHYLAGMLPPFWITKAFLAAEAGAATFWFFLTAGLIVHFAVIAVLLKRFVSRQR